jgi:hypothetical protein
MKSVYCIALTLLLVPALVGYPGIGPDKKGNDDGGANRSGTGSSGCVYEQEVLSTGGVNVGGFVGYDTGSLTDSGARTASEMGDAANYVGWDFVSTWAAETAVNDGFPYLRALP